MADKNIRMAILDDGVHQDVCSLSGNILIGDDLSIFTLKDNVSTYSHGSMCARIVQRYTELKKVDVYSIQILKEDTCRGNIERLLKAFELCASMDIHLIHLSVGTYAFEDFAKLEEAVWRLLDSNRFLVAATGNRGTVTYPAYLPGVIGVCHHPKLTDDKFIYCYDSFTKIHFQASARHKLIIKDHEIETPISNSYAAPLITAKILSYLKENADLGKDDILRLLMIDAEHDTLLQSCERRLYPSVEIPVVALSGFSITRLSNLIKLLVNCLHRDDYHVQTATNLPGIRPWDETIVPETIDLDFFITRMAWYFSSEIILLGLTSYISPDKYKNVSLWIYGDESNDFTTADDFINGQVLRAESLLDIEIYELMIAMLT